MYNNIVNISNIQKFIFEMKKNTTTSIGRSSSNAACEFHTLIKIMEISSFFQITIFWSEFLNYFFTLILM